MASSASPSRRTSSRTPPTGTSTPRWLSGRGGRSPIRRRAVSASCRRTRSEPIRAPGDHGTGRPCRGRGPLYGRTWLNPYTNPVDPADKAALTPHTCAIASPSTLASFTPRSLTFDQFLGKWMLVGTGSAGPRGIYYSLSDDLVSWSAQQLAHDHPRYADRDRPGVTSELHGSRRSALARLRVLVDPRSIGPECELRPSRPDAVPVHDPLQPGLLGAAGGRRSQRDLRAGRLAGPRPGSDHVPTGLRATQRRDAAAGALAVAFEQCTAPNREHAAPLAVGSCYPPRQASRRLTVGTVSANGRLRTRSARFAMTSCRQTCGSPSRRRTCAAAAICRLHGRAEGRSVTAHNRLRQWRPAEHTLARLRTSAFPVTMPCTTTADMTVGSTCAITTTANALVPGAMTAGERAIWQLGTSGLRRWRHLSCRRLRRVALRGSGHLRAVSEASFSTLLLPPCAETSEHFITSSRLLRMTRSARRRLSTSRKVSGSTKPSRANAEAFDRAVEEVTRVTARLLDRARRGGAAEGPRARGRGERASSARRLPRKRSRNSRRLKPPQSDASSDRQQVPDPTEGATSRGPSRHHRAGRAARSRWAPPRSRAPLPTVARRAARAPPDSAARAHLPR